MLRNQPGIDIQDLGLPAKKALQVAADLKFGHVELSTLLGELNPENLSASGRRHLRRYVENLGLGLSAVVGDIPGLRWTDPAAVDERVHRTRQILDLARDLDVGIVTASLGAVSHPESDELSPVALEAMAAIGEYADSSNRVVALRSANGDTAQMEALLAALGCPSLRVSLDPAAYVMHGRNPVDGVHKFHDRIALVHARDATVGSPSESGHETRLTDGDVDLAGVFAELAATDYAGPLIIRRTDSRTPVEDVAYARQKMQAMLADG